MEDNFSVLLGCCADFADIFELVKEAVQRVLGRSRAGLMLGLANLGGSRHFFLGAYYPVDSNLIVMNKFPLKRILQTKPLLFKPYVFHILLHEYLHSLDYLDEGAVRELTHKICVKLFGREHLVSKLSGNISEFLPDLSYPDINWFPAEEPEIEIVEGFDKGNLTYIS